MGKLIAKFEPADVIAILVVAGGLYLKLKGADGVVGSCLLGVTFYYFGIKSHKKIAKTAQAVAQYVGDLNTETEN